MVFIPSFFHAYFEAWKKLMITAQILSHLKLNGIHVLLQNARKKKNAVRNLKRQNDVNLVLVENKLKNCRLKIANSNNQSSALLHLFAFKNHHIAKLSNHQIIKSSNLKLLTDPSLQ